MSGQKIDYASKGKDAFRKYGVHHLSKSSSESLMDCSEKFVLRSRYNTTNPKMLLGQSLHGILETMSDRLLPFTEKLIQKKASEKKIMATYPKFLNSAVDDINIADAVIIGVHEQLEKMYNSTGDILYKGGIAALESETLQLAETVAKSVTIDHFKSLLRYPILYPELNVKYLHPGCEIPYEGFIDQVVLRGGKLNVADLKTTYSKNNYVWTSVSTLFQLWLYAQAFVQMGYSKELPVGFIGRMIIDTKPKSKVRPAKFEVTVEFKTLKDLSVYNVQFSKLMKNIEKMVATGLELTGQPKYGCNACSYSSVCTKKISTDVWEDMTDGS